MRAVFLHQRKKRDVSSDAPWGTPLSLIRCLNDFGAEQMTRLVALRASAFFTLLALAFGALGLTSHAAFAEALFMIAGSLCALMLVFAYAAPDHVAVPIRANRQRR